MSIYATAGAKLHIGSAVPQKSTDFVVGDFPAQGWIEIGGLDGLGSLGDTSQAVTASIINEGRDKTLKGTRSAGTMEVVANIDYADPGQQAAIAAERTIHDYAFRLTLNDAPAGGTPSMRYFIAKVMSQSEQLDTANNVMKLNLSLAVNSNIVRVDAAAKKA